MASKNELRIEFLNRLGGNLNHSNIADSGHLSHHRLHENLPFYISSSESESASASFAASSAAAAISLGTRECFGDFSQTQDNSKSKPLSEINVQKICYIIMIIHHMIESGKMDFTFDLIVN